ncbi:MAG: hypothetical protein M1828_007337 [Chrysothrix sp. TS-e1954]|nr:MAG: hypothetical protein M1828_007337 [Chrysothrix sp. TS-e1954]
MLAVVQAAFHVAQDYDQITYPILKAISAVSPGAQQQSASPLVQIRDRLVAVLHNAAIRSLFTTVFGTLWYTLFLRKTAWYGTFTIAQFIFTLPKNSKPPRYPQTIGDLLGRFFVEAFLLGLLWEFANVAFSTFVAQEPTKNGAPLTSDSKDPNGSLLAGLKSKKELPRSTAFWELALIAHRYPVRRQLIYKDIDRIGGSAWSQVLTICLAELHGIVKRVQDFHNPPKPTSLSNGQPLSATGTLPRIASPMRQDNVLKNPPPANGVTGAVASNAGTFTKAFGLSPGAEDPVIPRAKKLLTYGTDHFLIKEQQAQVSQSGLVAVAQEYFVRFLKSPLGEPFRTTFGRRALTVVLGTPTGSLSVIADAITGLSNIAVRSLKEDPYGKVQADVANIIRVFTSTAEVLESFLSKLPVHWTDVEFVEKQRRNIPEVETVLANLRAGLRDLINEFGEFREDLGLNRIELRRAKEVVSRSEKQSEELR